MNIVVYGVGHVGRALSQGWRAAGHRVSLVLREPDEARASAWQNQGFGVVTAAAAAAAGDVIVLAVPWTALPAVIESLGPLDGRIVVDVTNPLTSDLSLAINDDDSGGETVAELAPGARVVKAFNTTGAGNMDDSRYLGGKLMMPIAGDDAEAKKVVLSLASDLGFEAVDVGPLAMSRTLEPLAVLWIKLAHVQKLGTDFGFALMRREHKPPGA
jgi:predicted dinucleotide-binding enzyme